jgi:ABC-type multidrug transport system ATPase subunit
MNARREELLEKVGFARDVKVCVVSREERQRLFCP